MGFGRSEVLIKFTETYSGGDSVDDFQIAEALVDLLKGMEGLDISVLCDPMEDDEPSISQTPGTMTFASREAVKV